MKPRKKAETAWSQLFAYALGLLVTDGSLSKDGRHIIFTSKDRELVEHFCRCLHITPNIQMKNRIRGGEKNMPILNSVMSTCIAIWNHLV